MDADSPHFAHAIEDLPEDAWQEAAEIARTQPGISLRRRIRDEFETFGLDSYGTLEQARLLRFLARYPVTPYTYQVSELVSRGQRPDAGKLAELGGSGGYLGTINLCAEMPAGDGPAIAQAGLAGVLQTEHIPVTDMEPPTIAQVTQILDLLSGPGGAPTYVHCEAGKGRTGVAIACYRMAVTGWGTPDALDRGGELRLYRAGPAGVHPGVRRDAAGGLGRRPLPAGAVRLGQRDASAAVGDAPHRSRAPGTGHQRKVTNRLRTDTHSATLNPTLARGVE